jgi:SAM-dependent methyltransferase
MTAARLVRRRLLDPREAEEAKAQPIADAVNIPFSELAERLHELPPRDEEVGVVGPTALVQKVTAWLAVRGRRGVAVESFAPLRDADASEFGRLWEPNAFLSNVLPGLPPGRALDLACGTGRDAVFMASCGWDVTAVDVLADALSRARDLAARYAPALAPIRWVQLDLEREHPRLDRAFDLIVAFRYLHRPLFERLREWLRPGGSVLCETFTTVHRQRYGRPSREAHVLGTGELRKLLRGLEVRHYSEQWRGWAHTARIWAVLS